MKNEVAYSSATQEQLNYSTWGKTPKYGHNLNNMATIFCKKTNIDLLLLDFL